VRAFRFSLLFLPLLLAPDASAQLLAPFAGLFKSVNSVAIYGRAGQVPGGDSSPFRADATFTGFGAELYLDLPRAGGWLFELGLGTSYGRGNGTSDPGYDLRISTRSLPAFALYATHTHGVPFVSRRLQPYATVQFGFVDLWNAQAYTDAGLPFDVDGEAYDVAYGLGLGTSLGPVYVYAEGTRLDRRFASIDYSAPAGSDAGVPAAWPRTLDLSGWVLSYGVQVRLTQDSDPPPAFAGSWMLDAVDGQPVLVPPTATSTLIGGGLFFDPDEVGDTGRFTLWLLTRAGDGVREHAACGTYRTRSGAVELLAQSDACSDADPLALPASTFVSRDGQALALPLETGSGAAPRLLRFDKAD
jgi:hypothetical protein